LLKRSKDLDFGEKKSMKERKWGVFLKSGRREGIGLKIGLMDLDKREKT